ncbi:nitroreductase family deazaflavin-dependent oxidoreductase [Nocardia sp. NEAU-G5]|uniref:Nitroreductase family deazaflavin-dependent oxidoreductase n=1 Tax=Nocardia albiluteola TaxID=2842303 RepID=A0ABS6B2L7_9NOCA|nr:nitroreductase family deazaflavin-dependent oxidoreductase [Nocardia albiluteola]MBU3064536.1 nitroreductase family deazaflavin-dependent oxidoreductase [Nocardia albiluteola]
MSSQQRKRRLVNAANFMMIGLQRVGIAFGPMQLLTLAGRRTGKLRTFAIAVVPVAGQHYIVQAFPKAAWVANARAADQVTLTRGRRSRLARLVELPVEARRPVLRQLVTESPASVGKRYADNGLSPSPSPDDVAASAERIAVFRVETV